MNIPLQRPIRLERRMPARIALPEFMGMGSLLHSGWISDFLKKRCMDGFVDFHFDFFCAVHTKHRLHTRTLSARLVPPKTGEPGRFMNGLAVTGTQNATQHAQNMHGFSVGTPICHMVPMSRAYVYMGGSGLMRPSF